MNGAGLMAKSNKGKKKPEADSELQGGVSKKKQDPAVKLDPEFHRKLKAIAALGSIEMGALIEREMDEFIRREWARLKAMD